MRGHRVVWGLLATVLLVAAVYLALDNISVDVRASDLDQTEPAGEVGCVIAPWDAVLNDNDDRPGGEHSREYGDEVAAECFAASTTRFRAAVGLGLLGLVALVLTQRGRPRRVVSDEVEEDDDGDADLYGRR